MKKTSKTTGHHYRRKISKRIASVICIILLFTMVLCHVTAGAAGGLIIGSVQETEKGSGMTEGTERESETKNEQESETTDGSEKESETTGGSESEQESETANETETESEKLTEGETESESESEAETESESESEEDGIALFAGDIGVPQNLTFVYYPQNTLSSNSDAQKAKNINTVKYTVNLLDESGKLTTVTPEASGIPSPLTLGPEVTVAELLSHISVTGYTLENGYAFFFWNGNQALSGGMDLSGAGAHSVKTIKNFTRNSDYYGAGAGIYGGDTQKQVYGTIGYTMTNLGSNNLLSPGKTLDGYGSGNGDWNPDTDPSKKFYAYEYGGVLHIVLTPVSKTTPLKTRFYNYAESGEKIVDTTDCHDMEYTSNQWQGKLTLTELSGQDLTPPTDGYVFKGWYNDHDDEGNGIGTEIKGEEVQTEDWTVYARWEVKEQSVPDTSFVRVQKTFSGITADQIPDNFGIQIYSDAACTQVAASLSKNQATVNGTTLTWTVEDLAAGTYYVKETGTDISGKILTVTVAGGNVDAKGVITVTTQNPTMTASIPEQITSGSDTVFDLTSGYICASLTNNTYFIWTAEHLSVGEREALIEAITQNGAEQFGSGKITIGNSVFYSSADKLRNGIYVNNAYIKVSDGKLKFSQKSLWNQVAIGTYSKSQTQNAEIAVTNTYEQLHEIEITKVDATDLNKKLAGAQFKIEKLVSGTGDQEKYEDCGIANVITDSNGKAKFTGLTNGTYRITEIQAPDKYKISEKPAIVTLDDSTNGTYEITVKNAALYKLPATGGIGTYWFTVTGVAILMTAAWLFMMNLKKRRY